VIRTAAKVLMLSVCWLAHSTVVPLLAMATNLPDQLEPVEEGRW
jgi:hypothetical protein